MKTQEKLDALKLEAIEEIKDILIKKNLNEVSFYINLIIDSFTIDNLQIVGSKEKNIYLNLVGYNTVNIKDSMFQVQDLINIIHYLETI
jgi:hypothetical protein